MVMRYASAGEMILFSITVVAILVYGSAQPMFSVLFGASSDTVNSAGHQEKQTTWKRPVQMIGIGFVAGFFKWVQTAGLEIFAFTISHKIKMQYFKAVMGKDSTWFDANNPNEIATKIVKECNMIYRGIGEKIGGLYAIFAQIIVGLAIAFYISWELTLIIMGGIPVIMVASIIGVKATTIGVKEEMIAYQQCAGLAEQSL